MAKVFRPSNREAKILSRIESSKERAQRHAIEQLKEVVDPLSKDDLQEQIARSMQKLTHAEDFDIDYQIAPIRNLVPRPNVVSLYLTSFVTEQLINHRSVEDIYGSDLEIYNCINRQVSKYIH
jgi:hypothetical protein